MTIITSRYAPVPLTGLSITERLFQGLEHRPGDTVLIDGPSGRSVTAGALMEGIRRLAGGLTERGQGKGAVTGLMAPNIPEYVTVFHAVAWAGGTITTINPTYTAEELRHQLVDSGATMLITVAPFLETAKAGAEGTKVREIVVIGEAEGATPLADLMGAPIATQVPVDVERVVVVLPYSSGTTGLHMGVMLSHRNLVVNVDQALAAGDANPGDWTVAFLPFFHIYGLTVMMNMFLGGSANLVTLPRFDLELFLRLVQEHRARQLFIVPPVALALAKHPLVDQFDLSAVDLIFSGAAPLGGEVSEAAARRLGCAVVQGWGMTEISPIGLMSPNGAARPGSVGTAVPNTELRIVDPETGVDAAPGAEGELWVRGPQVMLGYLNRPDATAETIVEGGWLRTGDLATVDADGYVTIHDRLKELIKVKGFQVAPAELEAVLLTHADVTDCAVIGVPDEEAGERPFAHVVCRQGATLTEDAVKAHVLEHLSHYKALGGVRFVESVPKSASGKILRRLLRDEAR